MTSTTASEVTDSRPGPSMMDDVVSGFLVFLIALPLCLGISLASGFPPIAGVLSAIVGGVLVSFLGSSRLTIKGPAAGLIVIAIGAVTELGHGDPMTGYKRALAVGVGAAILQILFAIVKAGSIGEMMPLSVVHGMLAAIGMIIVAKQVPVVAGVTPHAKGPLGLLLEIPHTLTHANPAILLIGALSLVILFGWPVLSEKWSKRIPAPMLVLMSSIPLGMYFGLDTAHTMAFQGTQYDLGPQYLLQLPGSLMEAVAHPDFSAFLSWTSMKYVMMFALVGTVESVLSVSAVDAMDPERRASDLDKDLLATGIGNLVSASIGGLPMISEIVRSKANIDNGARSHWANFFHGLFLLLFVAAVPGLLQKIPLAALGAMLVYTGARLASPKEFAHAYQVGKDQLALFMTTLIVTLAEDLLLGVAAGLALKVVLHLTRGLPLDSIFWSDVEPEQDGKELVLRVKDAAVFTNFLGLRRHLREIDSVELDRVIVDLEGTWVVDHTVLTKLETIGDEWPDCELVVRGLDEHYPLSDHEHAARYRHSEAPPT